MKHLKFLMTGMIILMIMSFSFIHYSGLTTGIMVYESENNKTHFLYPEPAVSGTPDPFTFIDQFDVGPDAEVISEPVTITGLGEPVTATIIGGSLSVNNGEFTASGTSVSNMDQIRIRLMASSDFGQVTFSEILIGDQKAYFAVRTADDPGSGWDRVPEILADIQKPVFPDRDFIITDYGALGDGASECTDAFKNAITACHDSGGGKVIVPEGTYLTGPIHLQSNVNLYISKNAEVKFSTDPVDYLPVVFTRFEGTECFNYSPLVYAFEQENIAITGPGILNGQGDNEHWWLWKNTAGPDINALRTQAEQGVPVEQRIYGEGHYLRPPMIHPNRCNNILIDSITVLSGPFWHIHPVLCNNITVSNVSVNGHGPNNDGCNPESCKNVLIKNCSFDTGDDCITIKSGRNADGRRINVPTENVVVQNCTMKDGHGGVVIGSEISGGARNIYAEDCYMDSPNLDRALRIKTNSIRGGVIENIYLRNITVVQVADAAIRVNFYYQEGDIADFVPVVRNVEVRNMICHKSNYALRIDGYERSPVTDIRLINCSFSNTARSNHLSNIQNLCLNNVSFDDSIYSKILEPFGAQPLSTVEQSGSMNLLSELTQNYPNPFHEATSINFKVAESSVIELSVFDDSGKKIMMLLNEQKEPGEYKHEPNLISLPPGLYYYQLNTNHSSFTKRMVKY